MSSRGRFRDPTSSYSLYNLAAHPIDVVCPRCAAHARVTVTGDEQPSMHRPRRLLCTACGHTASWPSRDNSSCWGSATDPYFRRPLWLVTSVRGHRLWAFNREHLELLAEFVSADLRDRGPYGCGMSLVEKLPAWMKSTHNRHHVLAGVERLRARL